MAANLHLFKSHLRRKRFAFAVTPRWNGANIDAEEAPLRSANPDKARACCFSSTILAHSVGEQLPCASIQLLRAIVSNEENIISVIIAGNRTAWNTCDSLRKRRLVFFIKKRLDPDSFRKSPPERSGIDYRLSKVWSVIERGVFWLPILSPILTFWHGAALPPAASSDFGNGAGLLCSAPGLV